MPSVRTGRRRIRDPVLPPLPQRCPPRGHRARGRRSFGMDAGAECREQRQYPVPSPRSFSGAFCGRIRALHGLPHAPWPSIPNSRTAENGPGVFVAPVGFTVNAFGRPLLSPLSLSHCSPCAPRCRCCFAACPGREKRACLRVLCLPAALLAGMAEDTWLVAGGIGFSAGRARSL